MGHGGRDERGARALMLRAGRSGDFLNGCRKILTDLVQAKVAEACEARQEFRYFLQEPPKPPRKLSGCCAGRQRRVGIPAPRLF
jgi:hypothetical protein